MGLRDFQLGERRGAMLSAKSIPTTYKGVLMRSKLEVRWAREFDRWSLDWEYEPKQELVRHYTPDFFLPELGVWVEVKPTRRQARNAKVPVLTMLAEALAGTEEVIAVYGESGDFGCHVFLVPADRSGVWREYRWADYVKSRLVGRRKAWRIPPVVEDSVDEEDLGPELEA